jgi:prevent-host-death family protein
VESISISDFKARCLAVLERVRTSGEPILVTRRGVPVAEVVPPSRPRGVKRQLGLGAGSARIVGDLVAPVDDPMDWNVLRDPDSVLNPR